VSQVRDRRWDTDARGHGVADATALSRWVDELRELVTTADWVAEEPEVHLLPHVQRLVATERGVAITATRVSGGVLELDVQLDEPTSAGGVRETAYRLVSAIAESVTFVRQADDHEVATFEVVTGMPVGTAFATHGHTIRIRIRSPQPAR
jgi:hypothetical protein